MMAKSIDEIKAEMVAAKEAAPELDVLTSDSRYSIWGLIMHVASTVIYSLYALWDIFSAEVDDRIERSRVHTARWYRDRVLEFQYGKDLFWINGAFRYADIAEDESLETFKIIRQAAVVRSPSELIIKVAKELNGLLGPITEDEKIAFAAYMGQIGDAGTDMLFVSLNPDEVTIDAIIYCNPLLIDLSDGSLISDPQTKPAEQAAQAYVNIENLINFNGEFRRTDLIDVLQKAEGISDPVITSLKARYGSLPFEEIEVSYLPFSGYHRIIMMNFEYRAL